MSEELYLVTAYITQAEYEAKQKLPGLAGVIRLLTQDNDSDNTYGEEQIPRILRDAAVAAGLVTWQDTHDFADRYHCGDWPFPLKHLILTETGSLWMPPSSINGSEWCGRPEDAQEFFEGFPELKEAFTAEPDEVARKWLENNPQ